MKRVKNQLIIIFSMFVSIMILQFVSENINSVQAASKIKISTTSKTLYVGYGCKLRVTGTNKKVSWSSSDSKVAKVTQAGNVTAKEAGKATITAKVNGKKYTCKITVKDVAYINLYDTKNMKLFGNSRKVKYQSSNSKIASIDKNGKVTAKRTGIVTLTAKTGGKKYSCKLKVVADGWIKDSKGNIYYYENGSRVEGWKYIDGYKYYFYKNSGILNQNIADSLKGEQEYYIHVNRKQCKITIFAKDGDNGYKIPVMAMTCSVGTAKNATPTGTFNTMSRTRWGKLMGPSYGQYCTRIVGSILFHSVAGYNKTSYNLSYKDYNKLGQPASHGCVRLCVRDAKWIYDNCKIGTTVKIDDKSDGCKFDKPKLKKIKYYQHYDPTDPNVRKK